MQALAGLGLRAVPESKFPVTAQAKWKLRLRAQPFALPQKLRVAIRSGCFQQPINSESR